MEDAAIPFVDVNFQQKSQEPKSKSIQPDKCKYCDETFKTRNDLWMHICKYLQCDALSFTCKTCLKHIPKKDFDSHNHEVFTCLQCGKTFSSKRSLNLHEKAHEIEGDGDEEVEDEEIPKEILSKKCQKNVTFF